MSPQGRTRELLHNKDLRLCVRVSPLLECWGLATGGPTKLVGWPPVSVLLCCGPAWAPLVLGSTWGGPPPGATTDERRRPPSGRGGWGATRPGTNHGGRQKRGGSTPLVVVVAAAVVAPRTPVVGARLLAAWLGVA